jgi:rhodanese-related sulfurtransferase
MEAVLSTGESRAPAKGFKGFADVKHMEGGITAWQAEGLPVTK